MALSTGKKSLIQVLGTNGKISREQAQQALKTKQNSTSSLESILLEMGLPEADIYEAQAEVLGLPFVDISQNSPGGDVRGLIPEDMMDRHKAVPVRRDGQRLMVAMANPSDVFALDEMRMKTGMEVQAVMVPPSQLERLKNTPATNGAAAPSNGASPEVQQGAMLDDSMQDMLDSLRPAQKLEDIQTSEEKEATSEEGEHQISGGVSGDAEGADEAPIIRIVNTILMYALKDGASDIHIEPQRKGVRIRYRIDGVLHEQMKIPAYVLGPLVSRIKIMGDMNIAERRIPQDGRINIKMHDKDFDLRVSSCPTAFGEKVVMRILDKSSVLIGLDKLGLYPETQRRMLDICHQPNGMFFICGPTGSGKTTTLYSVLNVINSVEKNVMTVEDPIEYQLAGLSQVHVNRKAGLSFANALRSFLRQDPDIIMVGETRDIETAEIGVQAALTGHLVLSTIHTNDAPSTATRLGDMGVEPFLISAVLVGSLAQRLTRKICENCKEEHIPQRELLLRFGFDPHQHPDVKFYKGMGCDVCRQTGYKGRMGVYELMVINEEIAEMIVRRAPLSELKEAARANGMHTLQEDGFRKCRDGLTTIDEVMRVVFTGGH